MASPRMLKVAAIAVAIGGVSGVLTALPKPETMAARIERMVATSSSLELVVSPLDGQPQTCYVTVTSTPYKSIYDVMRYKVGSNIQVGYHRTGTTFSRRNDCKGVVPAEYIAPL